MDFEKELRAVYNEYKQGNKDKARKNMRSFIKANPTEEAGWFLYAKITNDEEERIRCLKRIIDINPSNQQAQDQIDRIRTLSSEGPFERIPPVDLRDSEKHEDKLMQSAKTKEDKMDEFQKTQLDLLKTISKDISQIKSFTTFLGILIILSIIGAICANQMSYW